MRSPARLFRSAVAGAAAVVLLTACGGSGDEEPAASSSSSSSSSSSASSSAPSSTPAPDPAAAEFCTQVTTAFQELSTTLGTNPTEVAGRLPEVVATLESVEAPADIAPDWTALLDGLRQLATTAGSLDLDTPEGQQQFSDAEAQLTSQLGPAQTSLTNYVVANCSLTGPTPTS